MPKTPSTKISPEATYSYLVEQWITTKDATAKNNLLEFMDTKEYRVLPYKVRNRDFITSSKLRAFEKNELYAKYEFVEHIPKPIDEETDNMTCGSAVDDWLTYGEEYYKERYMVVPKRTEAIIAECEAKGITPITGSMEKHIVNCVTEFGKHPSFPKLRKKNVLWFAFGKYPCKAELDHFEYESLKEFGDCKCVGNVDNIEALRDYLFQMSFYFSGILEDMNLKLPAHIYAVDRYKDFSRSEHYLFTVPTLEAEQGRINSVITRWVDACDTGIFRIPDLNTIEGRKAMRCNSYYLICPFARAESPIEL